MGAGVGLASLMHRVTWRATTDDAAASATTAPALTGTLVAKFAPTDPAVRRGSGGSLRASVQPAAS